MKAIVIHHIGPFGRLKLEDVPKPIPFGDEVLIKVHASSVNYNNLAFSKGASPLLRLVLGFAAPKHRIPGGDLAGAVEAAGANVKGFKPGDEVFGYVYRDGTGAWAEYACAPESVLAHKPANLTFEEAAASVQAAFVALQGLRLGEIRSGQKVLVCGASGGIGTFAVQMAKAMGAEVTGVCGTRNMKLVRSLGADHVLDYLREDFTQNGQRYDLILATAGYRPIRDYEKALAPEGIYVVTGCAMRGRWALRQIIEAGTKGRKMSAPGGKQFRILSAKMSRGDLVEVKALIEAGKVRPVTDGRYVLEDVPRALAYYGKGHATGKVIITI
jgi:NADPH:quinone reductase-like Zn-dependent oxidoreductase